MNPSQNMDIINEIERSFPVDEWVIDNLHVWPIIRISLAYEIADIGKEQLMSSNPKNRWLSQINRLVEIIKGVFCYIGANVKDASHNAKPHSNVKITMLGYSADRNVKLYDREWYDVLRDPFVNYFKQMDMESLLLELTPNNKFRLPRYSQSFLIQPIINFLKVGKYLFPGKSNNINLINYDKLNQFLKERNIRISVPSEKELRKRVSVLYGLAKYFKKILNQTNSLFGMVVCYYGIIGMAFNLACRDLGILSVDIQHGVAGDLHPAYGRWQKVPVSGYELLPSVFWCWSPSDAQTIDQWNHQCPTFHQPVLGGNLWLRLWKNNDHEIVQYYDRLLGRLLSGRDGKNILVTLQNGYNCPEMVFEAIRRAPSCWRWWIRVHPTMMSERDKIKKQFCGCGPEKIEIDAATDLPLAALLRHIDAHVTTWSAVVYDAETFGVYSVVVHPTGVDLFYRQVESGIVLPAYTPQDLLSALMVQMEKTDGFRKQSLEKSGDMNGIERLFSLNPMMEKCQSGK